MGVSVYQSLPSSNILSIFGVDRLVDLGIRVIFRR